MPFLRHLGEDVVGGAVDDAVDADDFVGDQIAQQRRYDGRAAGDARLEQDLHVLAARRRENVCAALRHNLFVGGNDVLAKRYGFQDVVQRGLFAAHNLYDDVHIGVVENVVGVGGENAVGQCD